MPRIARLRNTIVQKGAFSRKVPSAELGMLAEGVLRKALAGDPPLESRRRIEGLLQTLDNPWPRMSLQSWRALAVLERIGNGEARQVLEKLAEGDPDTRLMQEARASLGRLRRETLQVKP